MNMTDKVQKNQQKTLKWVVVHRLWRPPDLDLNRATFQEMRAEKSHKAATDIQDGINSMGNV